MVCPKLDNCEKISMVLDKDMADFQYADSITKVCEKCTEPKEGITIDDLQDTMDELTYLAYKMKRLLRQDIQPSEFPCWEEYEKRFQKEQRGGK
jgi:hypothetical protein